MTQQRTLYLLLKMKIIEQSYNLEDKFEPKKYILRKIDTNISDIDIAKDKINQKKAQGATDDDW